MEMNDRKHPHLPSSPPPYSAPESSNTPGVIVTPPSVNVHGIPNSPQNTSPTPYHDMVISNIVIPKTVGPIPTPCVCSSCNNMIVTTVETSITMKQHLFAILLCGIGFWPCVFVPYVIPSCRKAHHFCPICTRYIGTYV